MARMTAPPTPTKPFELALEPLDPTPAKPAAPEITIIEIPEAPTRPAGPARVSRPAEDSPASAPDRFVAQATRELHDGALDQRLWSRVLLVSGEDQSQAKVAYIRARATALRLAARDQRASPDSALPAAAPETAPSAGTAPASRPAVRRGRPPLLAGALAAGLVAVVAVTSWIALRSGDAPSVVRAPVSGPRTPAVAAPRPRDDGAAERAAAAVIAAGLEARVKALRDAGNWNVMVLNAAEWTRKQPDNATAWSLLAVGYVNLGQLADAREAAATAAQRAPDNGRLWRDLGAIDVALDQPERALGSFTRASALDAQDFESLVQAGLLEAQLQRLPDARADFDKALALRADDETALCGLAGVARQQGHAAEADALHKRVKAAGKVCATGISVGVRTAAAERPGTGRSAGILAR